MPLILAEHTTSFVSRTVKENEGKSKPFDVFSRTVSLPRIQFAARPNTQFSRLKLSSASSLAAARGARRALAMRARACVLSDKSCARAMLVWINRLPRSAAWFVFVCFRCDILLGLVHCSCVSVCVCVYQVQNVLAWRTCLLTKIGIIGSRFSLLFYFWVRQK